MFHTQLSRTYFTAGLKFNYKACVNSTIALHKRNASTSKLRKEPAPPATTRTRKASQAQSIQTPTRPKSIVSGTKTKPIENASAQKSSTDAPTDAPKRYQEMSEEEREQEIQRLLQMSELMPTMDPFGQEFNATLDVTIPYPNVKLLSFSRKNFQHFKSNFENNIKNATALNLLSAFDAIPGKILMNNSLLSRLRHKFKLFSTQSTKPDGLLAPFRQIALESYEDMNAALANRSEREIRKLTTWDYQEHTLGLVKTSLKNNPKGRLIWQLHRVVEPVQILSIRVTQGHFGETEPKYGNRLLAHALIKFDTEQSLEIYDRLGKPLHPPGEREQTPSFIEAGKKQEKWRVPAVKRRVQEYMVLEKRMWVQSPWVFREQMWPTWPLEENAST